MSLARQASDSKDPEHSLDFGPAQRIAAKKEYLEEKSEIFSTAGHEPSDTAVLPSAKYKQCEAQFLRGETDDLPLAFFRRWSKTVYNDYIESLEDIGTDVPVPRRLSLIKSEHPIIYIFQKYEETRVEQAAALVPNEIGDRKLDPKTLCALWARCAAEVLLALKDRERGLAEKKESERRKAAALAAAERRREEAAEYFEEHGELPSHAGAPRPKKSEPFTPFGSRSPTY